MRWLLFYSAAVSLLDFLLCGADKYNARKGRRRVPERTLLLLAVLGGGWGLWLGMLLFRHKTRHLSFRILAPLASALWAAALVWCRFA